MEDFLHHWAVSGLTAAREAASARWADQYLIAQPCWFALPAGLIKASPIVGVWIPSADAANRFFPLVAYCRGEPRTDVRQLFAASLNWFARMETLLSGVFDPDTSFDDVEAGISEAVSQHEQVLNLLSDDNDDVLPVDDDARQQIAEFPAGKSIWMQAVNAASAERAVFFRGRVPGAADWLRLIGIDASAQAIS